MPQSWDLCWAIVLGVLVAELVTWLSGAEHDLAIRTEGQPLWPVDGGRLRHSIMLMLTVAVAHVAGYWSELSSSTTVSVMLLTITPDFHALLRKGKLRVEGRTAGDSVCRRCDCPADSHPESSPLQVLLLFLGTFLATLLWRTSVDWGYAGVQMGLVLPMILVVPQQEFGSLAFARVGGAAPGVVDRRRVYLGSAFFLRRRWRRPASQIPRGRKPCRTHRWVPCPRLRGHASEENETTTWPMRAWTMAPDLRGCGYKKYNHAKIL